MAKRRCPFEYDLSPQMKIHVSDKEIARAGSQENMSSIYGNCLLLIYLLSLIVY